MQGQGFHGIYSHSYLTLFHTVLSAQLHPSTVYRLSAVSNTVSAAGPEE